MQKLLKSLFILLILSCSYLAQEREWKPFSPPVGGWTILAPGPMRADSEAKDAKSKMGSYSYNDFSGFFAVIYRDAPKIRFVPWGLDTQTYMKQNRDDAIKAVNGQLIKDEVFTNGLLNGREIYIKMQSGTMIGVEGQSKPRYRIERARMFFHNKRFFVLLAVLPENEIDTPAVANFFNSFVINTPPKGIEDSYSINEDTTLTINAANGVLANDKDEENDPLTVSKPNPLTAPAHGKLTLNTDGSFIYQPDPNFNGRDSFTYKTKDKISESEPTTVTIIVNPVNDPPTIADVPASATIDELVTYKFLATANDIDNAASSLRFSLTGSPKGAVIDPKSGAFSWMPDESQGPGNYTFQVNVTDGEATTSAPISLSVREVNIAPILSNVPATATINELEPYSFAAKAVDGDIPIQTLTFSLINVPQGAVINPTTGVFAWTPTEAQGDGSTYKFTVRVSDGQLNTDAAVSLVVKEVNSAPILEAIPNQTIDELKPMSLISKGSDNDIPANSLTYSLDAGNPAGMTINAQTGEINWTPTEAQGPGDYAVTVRVTDNGTPTLSDSKTFKVHVNEVNVAPVLSNIPASLVTINELEPYSFTAKALDSDLPTQALTFSLINAPTGAVIDPVTGVFNWTPSEAQGPGNYSTTIRVTDNGSPTLFDTKTFNIQVNEVNVAPKLNIIGDKTIDEETNLTFKVSATDSDLPANTLTYSLINPPTGANINPTTGVFNWTPSEAQGPENYSVTIRVTDNGTPNLFAEQTIKITVNEVNKPPVASNSTVNTDEDTAISVNLKATDPDLPLNTLVYSIVNSPIHGKLSGTAPNLTYTPNPDFNGDDSFTFKVNDGRLDSNTGTIYIKIKPVNDAPIANPDNVSTSEDTPITIMVEANDTDVDGDAIVLTGVSNAVNGKAEIINGKATFTPNLHFHGTGSFNYTISDGKGGTAIGLVTVTVNAAKPKP